MISIELTGEKLGYCRDRIEDAIRDIVRESNSRGVVVALSGGIDSAVVLKLASGAADTYALIMPERDVTPEGDVRDAENLAKSLEVDYSIIEINDVIESVRKLFPWTDFKKGNKRISDANIKPRVRMIFTYLTANLDGRIVLGTGNRTELLLGYTTKYGDNACDLEPIGDLYKTQVRQLARYIGLPEQIIEKTPSAGLWGGQTDEKELGAGYGDMDRILHLLVDGGYSIEKTALELGLDPALVKRMQSRMEQNKHKRMMPKSVKLID